MDKKVEIYTTSTCPHCKNTKRFLDEHNIDYTNYEVNKDKDKAREMKEKSGQMGVPVIDVDGKIIVGFDKSALKDALDIS